MALIKQRPHIELLAPRVIIAGERVSVCVRLHCAQPVPIDGIEVSLVGRSVSYRGSSTERERLAFPSLQWDVRPVQERIELEAGLYECRAELQPPSGVPGTYHGRSVSFEWSFVVHVDIPWWLDARARFVTHVVGQRKAAERWPEVCASSTKGPQGREPYAELLLESQVVESGGPLRGTLTLANTEHNDYRELELVLMAAEMFRLDGRVEARPLQLGSVPIEAPTDHAPIQFAVQLPNPLTPAFNTQYMELKWFLRAAVVLSEGVGAQMVIPIWVRPMRVERLDEDPVSLAVESEDVVWVWRSLARSTDLELCGGELARELEDGRLTIRREPRERTGTVLVAEVVFRDLNLGLRAERGRLRCRDAEQSRLLAEQTDTHTDSCTITHADDERIVCVDADYSTKTGPLEELVERMTELWRAVVKARAGLPAPRTVVDAVPGLRAAALFLGAEFDHASMDVRGVRGETAFSLKLQWHDDGQPARTVLIVRPSRPIEGRWHQTWDGRGELGPLPLGLADLLDDARGVRVDPKVVELFFDPCRGDPSDHVERLEELLDVVHRLGEQAGDDR